ncbi:hypothetical protein BCR43DRAFT_510860 [Syncephalastrum racemosum]|uniref:Uncharacterized protein n=1 Tax=Syncephalastrum racemosum TaxID=13706 RepID=A0A1X2HWB0_SYNRA|nr:hypothetical protein BCR43DRAFT_510860 [Syncephalastrum racemosum]
MRSILFLAAATAICLSGAVFAQDANSNSGELQASGSEPPPVSESQPVTDAVGDVVGDVGSIPDYIGADPASAAGSPGIVGRPDSG